MSKLSEFIPRDILIVAGLVHSGSWVSRWLVVACLGFSCLSFKVVSHAFDKNTETFKGKDVLAGGMLRRELRDFWLRRTTRVKPSSSSTGSASTGISFGIATMLGFSKTGSGTHLSERTDVTKAAKIIDNMAGTQFA
jgi:hypothetical protein